MNEWFEMVQCGTIDYLVEQIWLCRYPGPEIFACNSGNEFLFHALNNYLIQQEYIIKPMCATM